MLAMLRECVAHAAAPLEHPHYLAYYVLCRHAAAAAKVLITGEGADELFMGYEHYRTAGASFAFREYLLPEDEDQFDARGGRRAFDVIRADAHVTCWRDRALSSRAASREYELKSHLLTLLSRNDKMGMAHSVEIRAPYLDRRIVALALGLPEAALVADGSPKQILKQEFVARFPGMAPQPRKIGFRVPFDDMFTAKRHGAEIERLCGVALDALRRECGLAARPARSISPRLGWSLVNIGMFLEAYGR
jgi:asparagine synthase (glutamine-hydrolysing)